MSDPKPDFQQLLSDHLDGWLTGDDLGILERQLSEDAELRDLYQTMLADRDALRAVFAEEPSAALPANFARQVISEAVRRRDEMVDPVTLASGVSQRSNGGVSDTADETSGRRRNLVVGLMSTAAAALMMWSLWFDRETASPQVAQVTQSGQEDRPRGEMAKEPLLAESFLAEPRLAESGIADSAVDAAASELPSTMKVSDAIASDAIASDPNAMVASAESLDITSDRDWVPDPSEVATASEPTNRLDRSSTVAITQPIDDTLSGAVLVYDVRLTSRGRVTSPVGQAIQRAGLPETSRQPIDRALVDAAKGLDTFDPESEFQILYLRASAKQLDRLFDTLLRDRDNVGSVGLSLVTNSPILKITDNLERVDATLVQRDEKTDRRGGASYQLESDGEQLAVLRRLLEDQTFLPMTPNLGTPGSVGRDASGTGESGRDVMSRVLVIVR